MIVADVLGPWWDVEATDDEGNTYREQRRLPQFLHDAGDCAWRDVTAQAADMIPPTPGLGVWRLWCDEAQLAQLVEAPGYEVLRSAEVDRPHRDPATWPVLAAPRERAESTDAFPPLPGMGTPLEAHKPYQYGESVVVVRQAHTRTEHEPSTVPALFLVWRPDAGDGAPWIAQEQVYVGTVRTYEGVTYRCRQAHPTEYTPDITPALWEIVVEEPTEPQPWVQPTGAHDVYHVGDRVTYNGFVWECTAGDASGANSWAPGVYGWTQVRPL